MYISCNENNGAPVVMPYFLEVEVHSIIHFLQNIFRKTTNFTRRCTFLFQDLILKFTNY